MAPTVGPKKQARLQKLASAFDPAKVQEQVQVAKDYKANPGIYLDAMTKAGYSISSAAQFDNLLENSTLRHQWLEEQVERGNEELKIQEEEIELAREDVQEFEKFFQAYKDVIDEWDIKDEKTDFLALVEESRAFEDIVTQVKGLLVRFPNLAARISTSPEIKQAVEAALKDERASLDQLKQQFYDIDQRALDRVAQKFDELNLEQRLEDRVSSIQELLDAANGRQSKHHSTLLQMQSDHTKSLNTLQVEKQVVETELTETTAQLADANEAKDEGNKRSDRLQDQVTSLESDKTDLKNNVARLEALLTRYQTSSKQAAAAEKRKTDKIISDLEQQKSSLEQDKDGLLQAKNSLVQQNTDLEQELTGFRNSLATTEIEVANLRNDLAESEKEKTDLHSSLSNAFTKVDQLSAERDELSTEKANLQTDAAQSQEKITDLRDSLATTQDELTNVRQTLENSQLDAANLRQSLADAQREMDALRSTLHDTQSKVIQLSGDKFDLEKAAARDQGEMTELRDSLATARDELTDVRQSLANTQDEMAALRSTSQDEITEQRNSLATAKGELTGVRQNLGKAQQELTGLHSAFQEAQSKIGRLSRDKSNLENETSRYRGEIIELRTSLDTTQQELVDLRSSHQSDIDSLSSQNAQLKATIDQRAAETRNYMRETQAKMEEFVSTAETLSRLIQNLADVDPDSVEVLSECQVRSLTYQDRPAETEAESHRRLMPKMMFGNDGPPRQPVQHAVTFCLGALSGRMPTEESQALFNSGVYNAAMAATFPFIYAGLELALNSTATPSPPLAFDQLNVILVILQGVAFLNYLAQWMQITEVQALNAKLESWLSGCQEPLIQTVLGKVRLAMSGQAISSWFDVPAVTHVEDQLDATNSNIGDRRCIRAGSVGAPQSFALLDQIGVDETLYTFRAEDVKRVGYKRDDRTLRLVFRDTTLLSRRVAHHLTLARGVESVPVADDWVARFLAGKVILE
ncbi:MAG: hypothetical protein Q9180_002558 [Flavoplaca navasiana]